MNILDTFYFLFKTNSKEAEKDVERMGHATRRAYEEVKKAGEEADKTTISFSKLALAGVAALEGFASLNKLKEGIFNSIDYNAQIEKTAKLTNTNARELSIWNDVVSRAGGNPNGREYINFITQLNQKYAALGVNDRIKRVGQDLVNISAKFQELERNSPGSSQALAAQLGIGPDLWLGLKDGPAVLQANIRFMGMLDNTTEKTAKSGLSLKQQWSDIAVASRSWFTAFEPFAKILTTLLRAIISGAAIGQTSLTNVLFHPLDSLAQLGRWGRTGSTAGGATPAGNAIPKSNEDESRDYWKSLGYTDAQIAALLANEKAEGGFQSNAVGDNGQARGLFQWHAARRARILAATGIDVSTATHDEQLRAAAWELQNTGTDARLRSATSPEQGAAILTQYEAPANADYQAFARGQQADSYYAAMMQAGQGQIAGADATQIPGASTSNSRSIVIGSVTVHTQATDAKGIAQDLHGELASTVQSFDDGVQY